MGREWKERSRPLRLENRYEFANYEQLREFLDQAADLSEREDFYPDMGFGRDYVNITIHADQESGLLEPRQRQFAQQLEELNERMSQARA